MTARHRGARTRKFTSNLPLRVIYGLIYGLIFDRWIACDYRCPPTADHASLRVDKVEYWKQGTKHKLDL